LILKSFLLGSRRKHYIIAYAVSRMFFFQFIVSSSNSGILRPGLYFGKE
jgi:hypothetical protein